MAAVHSKDTQPELIVRRLVHMMGYRYRLYRPDLPGKPDLVFPGRQKVIFVHGCFWHQHGCGASHLPKSNVEYWTSKLELNKRRDTYQIKALHKAGWQCLILWECELKNTDFLKKRIKEFLG